MKAPSGFIRKIPSATRKTAKSVQAKEKAILGGVCIWAVTRFHGVFHKA